MQRSGLGRRVVAIRFLRCGLRQEEQRVEHAVKEPVQQQFFTFLAGRFALEIHHVGADAVDLAIFHHRQSRRL